MNNTWLIGAGGMAVDYIKVLQALGKSFTVIGRSKESATACKKATGCEVIAGGLTDYLSRNPALPSHAIVAVGVEMLCETTLQLLDYGVRNILVEKPAGMNISEIEKIYLRSTEKKASVIVAYNRRFYTAALKALEIAEEDGGITSFNFEFTEWAHTIEPLKKGDGVKEKWFLANSTHVVDLAFYLGGRPKEISTFISGKLNWHPSASVFSGAGISEKGALFSYQANWESAGRWSVELLTKRHRLIFRPMEKLQIQNKGSVETEFVSIDDKLDIDFKPGLYRQVDAFIHGNTKEFCTIEEQCNNCKIYNKIAGY